MTEEANLRLEALRRQALLRQQQLQGTIGQQGNTQPERGFGAMLYDNVVGNPNDGVNSPGERLGTWLNRAGESMTLGVVGDEAAAAATGLLPGRTYESELDRYRGNEEAMSPLARTSADIFGAVLPAATGIGMVSAAPSLGRAALTGASLGAGAGTTYGLMEGEGGFGPRASNAAVGGITGGVIGGAIPPLASFGGQIYRSGQTAMRNSRVGRDIGRHLDVSPEAGRVVARLVGEGDQAGMSAAIDRAGPAGMLADASPGAAGMLDSVMRSPTPGASLARERVDARAGDAYHGIMDALVGGQQGPRLPPLANQSARAASARPTINPLYEAAYNTPINYATPEGQAVESILSRAPVGLVQRAIEAARQRMTYDQLPTQQIMAEIGDNNQVSFSEMPNTMMADYIRRSFDEVAEGSRDSITSRMTPEGQFANRIARDLRNALAEAVPGYDQALSAASADIRERSAVRFGQTVLRPSTAVEDVAEEVANASPAELRAMRQGVIGQIDHAIGNVRAVASDPNVDARQAMQAFREMSSPNARQNMQALFGDDWPAIEAQLNQASSALYLRSGVAGNSATQPRQAAQGMIAEEIAPGPIRALRPLASAREVGQRALGSDPASIARLGDEVNAELADVLTRSGGQETLTAVMQALANNQLQATAGRNVRNGIMGAGFATLPTATERIRNLLLQ